MQLLHGVAYTRSQLGAWASISSVHLSAITTAVHALSRRAFAFRYSRWRIPRVSSHHTYPSIWSDTNKVREVIYSSPPSSCTLCIIPPSSSSSSKVSRGTWYRRIVGLFGSLTSTYLPSSSFMTMSTNVRTMAHPLFRLRFI